MAKTLSTMLELGSLATKFILPDTNLKTINQKGLAEFNFNSNTAHKGYLITFICNHCPFVIHIAEPYAAILNKAQEMGIKTVAISANDVDTYPADSPEKMAQFAEQYGFSFPYLYDADQSVAKAYTAACTPDFFLFDETASLVYRGQFDSSRPGNGVAVTGDDLNNAVDSLLNGKEINKQQSASVGCNIKWKTMNAPEYFS